MSESRKIARGSLILFPEATRWTKPTNYICRYLLNFSFFFPRVTFPFSIVPNLGKFFGSYSFTSARSAEESNNATKPIPSNDRIAVSARWIPISWSLRYARSWVKSLSRQTRLHRRYECPQYFPDYSRNRCLWRMPFDIFANGKPILPRLNFFLTYIPRCLRGRGRGRAAFDPFRKPKAWRSVDPGRTTRPRNGDSNLYVRV